MMRLTPASDSSSINSQSVTVSVKASDVSGVGSVVFLLNDATTSLVKGTLIPVDSTWTAVISSLVVNKFNKITIIATDSSLAQNKDSLSFMIKYDPTIEDTTGPSIIQIDTTVSGSKVTSPVVTIVDSIVDPSGISSVSYTVNGGVQKTMPEVAGKSDLYSFTDTLKENINTIIIYAYDNTTKKTKSMQTITLNYIIPPQITLQPKSQSVCNEQAVFSLTATGTGPLSYQWQKGASTFTPITGAANPVCTLKTLTSSDSGTIISCLVSNGSNTIRSELCTLTVNTPSTTPDAEVTPLSICRDSAAILFVASGTPGTGASWKWYTSKNGNPLSTIKVFPTASTWYYVRGEGTCGYSAWDSVYVKVDTIPPKPTITASLDTVCSGTPTTLTATGTPGTNGTWNWYTNKADKALTPTTLNTLTVSPLTTTTYFARGEGTCGASAWDSITIYVKTKPVISSHPSNVTVCEGNRAIFSVSTITTGATPTTYQWRKGTTNLQGMVAPSCTLAVTSSDNGAKYSCIVTNDCGDKTSNAATLTINTASVKPTSVYDSIIHTGSTTVVHILKIVGGKLGTGASWYWYCREDGNTVKGNDSILSILNQAGNYYYVRAKNSCNTTDSVGITLSP